MPEWNDGDLRDPEEIEEAMGDAIQDVADGINRWPGMSYAQGVQSALAWVLGESDDHPMHDEEIPSPEVIQDQAETYCRLKKPARRPSNTVDPEKF